MRHRLGAPVPALTWIAAVALLAAGAACGTGEPPTDTYELSGLVTDNATGRPLSGVRVTFTADTLYSGSTTTDSDGEYEMLVESDTLFGQVRAEKEGYRTKEETVYFDRPVRRLDLQLLPLL